MVRVIYADILFLINFIINYLILFSSGHIGAVRIRSLRIILSAALGSIYGVLVFFPAVPYITSFPAKLLISVLMIIIAFGRRYILKNTLIFLAVSLAFGGVVFAASLLGLGDFCEVRGGVYYIHISVPALLISSFAAYLLLSVIFRRAAANHERRLCDVSVSDGGRELSLIALRDTGNSLRDGATNAPVIISDYKTLREILPREAAQVLDALSVDAFSLAYPDIKNFGTFKLLPYKTVGVEFSLMLAFRPGTVIIDGEKTPDALIAISPHRVSDGGAYSALI